jgi:hypothetical protein
MFAKASVRKKPTVACIGYVSDIGEAKPTRVNEYGFNYIMIPIQLAGYGASLPIKVNFMFRPEWLQPGFDPESLHELEHGSTLYSQYSRHINQAGGGISTLFGLVGADDEKFNQLAEALQEVAPEAESDPEIVANVLREKLVDEELGKLVGYVLSQQKEKSVDPETGKVTYLLTPYYQVDSFFVPDEKGRARQIRRAEKTTDGSFRVYFAEEDVPF